MSSSFSDPFNWISIKLIKCLQLPEDDDFLDLSSSGVVFL